MDYKLNEEQAMLKSMASDFLKNKLPKSVIKEILAGEAGSSLETGLYREMAGLGWMGLIIPEAYGGSGNSFLDLAVLCEEMGRACVPAPFFASVMFGAYPLLEAGTGEQKQKYLPSLASGASRFTAAICETDGRYEAGSVRTKAVPSAGDFIITGTKLFVPSALTADRILCAARTRESGRPEDGITIFIVDAKSQGIRISALKTIDNEKLCEVEFNNVRVSASDILGPRDKGWDIVRQMVKRAAAVVCCDILGGLQQVLDMTVQYAKDRKQFDQPIGKFQIIQHYCADMATDIEGLRYITYRAAWSWSEGQPSDMETAAAKAWAAQAGERVLALAHQIHGAIGVTLDHDLQYYTKRFKAGSALYGDEDFYRQKVGEGMGL